MKDSIDKIKEYLKLSAIDKKVVVSPLFFRDYDCPPMCGGCCKSYTIDYIADSKRYRQFKKNYPDIVLKKRIVDGVEIYSELNNHREDPFCKFLNQEDGRCNIHESNPFACSMELIRFMKYSDKTVIINKLYGRGHQMKRVDGCRGALCKMTDLTKESFLRNIELLQELYEYSKLFGYETKLPDILNYLNCYKNEIMNNVKFRKQKIEF